MSFARKMIEGIDLPQDPNTPIAQIYSKVLDLFQDKSRFAQGYYNYDKDGNKCGWAVGYSYCALGACCFFGEGFSHKAQCCLQRVSEHLYGSHIQVVNDSTDGYERVQTALKFAIQLWEHHQPTEEELSMSVTQIIQSRNG